MTANCYSKSVLRAVVEEIVARHDQVQYFPSYESVVLSDRGVAWTNDFTHVTDTLIGHNVDRLVRKLTESSQSGSNFEAIRTSIEAAGASAAYLHAIEARKGDAAEAARFFKEFGEWSGRSPTFATEHVEWLVDQRQADKALEIAAIADVHTERMAMARSRALLILKRGRDALRILHDPMFERSRSNRYWSLRVQAEGMVGDLAALEASLAGWCQAHPKRVLQARLHVARALLLNSSTDRALELIKLALVEDPESALAHMLAAEAHLHRGEQTRAARSFALAQPKTDSEVRRYNKLKDRIGEFVGA
jgi:predicted Zn-dependent protease